MTEALEKSYRDILNIPEEHSLKLIDKKVVPNNRRDDEYFVFEEHDKDGNFIAKYIVESKQETNLNSHYLGKKSNPSLSGASSIIKYDAEGKSTIIQDKSW